MNKNDKTNSFDQANSQLLEKLDQLKKPEKWTVFDDETQPDFEFKPLSNRNIRAVMLIPCNSKYSNEDERIYYANLGEIAPDEIDEDKGEGVYKFKDTFDSQHKYYGALAQAMFRDFPTLVDIDEDGDAHIVDPDLSDKLLRDKVHEAFNFFIGKFGQIPYTQAALLDNLMNAPTHDNLGRRILKATQNAHSTKNPKSDGDDK